MFWTKLGTSTGVAASGTVEKVDEFVAAGKPALLYFSSRPVSSDKIDLEPTSAFENTRSLAVLVELRLTNAMSPAGDRDLWSSCTQLCQNR